MCCFSGPVEEVSNTKIFARRFGRGQQYLVYQMEFESLADLAMILPLPTPADAPEDALTFIDLKEYEHFFDDMQKGFPEPPPPRSEPAGDVPLSAMDKKLEVVEVGNFEASFVPRIKDFRRLDGRFRLPADVWDKLPAYAKYGFAVFKLKQGDHKVHPMAFSFPTTLKTEIFFPTVHIHDGQVHDKAAFDHLLYLQCRENDFPADRQWKESDQPAELFMNQKQAGKLIQGDAHVYRRWLVGQRQNADTLV